MPIYKLKFFFQGFLTTISQATCHSTMTHFMNDLKKGPIGLMCYFAGAPAAGKSSTYDPAVRKPLAAITKEFGKPISSMVRIMHVCVGYCMWPYEILTYNFVAFLVLLKGRYHFFVVYNLFFYNKTNYNGLGHSGGGK